MTNAEYIKSIMTDRDLAGALSYSVSWAGSKTFKKAHEAYNNWAKDTDRFANRNYEIKGEKPANFWYYFGHVRGLDNKWKNTRTTSVCFQVWLSLQYNPKHWG